MVLLRFYSYLAGNGRKWEENMFSDFSTRVGQVLTRVLSDKYGRKSGNSERSLNEGKSVLGLYKRDSLH